MDLTGAPLGPPTKSGLSLVDYSGGLVAAISILAGVHAARRDGAGMDCGVGLLDTALSSIVERTESVPTLCPQLKNIVVTHQPFLVLAFSRVPCNFGRPTFHYGSIGSGSRPLL